MQSPAGARVTIRTVNRLVAIVAGLAVIGALLWFLVFRDRSPSTITAPATGSSTTTPKATTAEAPDPAQATPTRSGSAARPKAEKLSRERRDALLAQIRDARAKKQPSGSPPPPAASSEPPAEGTLDRAYIKAAVQEIVPLLLECYTSGLDRDAKLGAGSVVVDFTIEGEQAVGGVIGESQIVADKTEIADPEFRQCIQETMYALAIDPPPNGGVVRVTYPFMFSNNE